LTKPQAYNKQKIMNRINRALERTDQEIFDLFFVAKWDDGTGSPDSVTVLDFVKNQVSKDLNVPWHQITTEQVQVWRSKGFEPVEFPTWWKKPNEEEDMKMSNMHMGCILRKEL
jgi:hypothetical protein